MILHVDGDGFFAACEVARFPHLKGKPVVVGEDRGIACAMTYEAKALGIHRAMPIFKIKQQFPHVARLSAHFELYHMYSQKLYRVLCRFTEKVEHYSVDECFVEFTETDMKKYGSWEKLVSSIKHTVQVELGITFSFGLASTKVLAKVASKLEKPDGCTVLHDKEVAETLSRVPIGNIWGIGWRLGEQFRSRGWKFASSFASLHESSIKKFAKPLQELWYELNGKSVMPVLYEGGNEQPKSLQAVRTFSHATMDETFMRSELSRNIEVICMRLREHGLYAGAASIFWKHGLRGFTSAWTRFPRHTNNPSDMLGFLEEKIAGLHERGVKYRATGITVMEFRNEQNLERDLFGEQETILEKSKVLKVVDTLHARFGTGAINLASSLSSISWRKKDKKERTEKDTYVWGLPLPYMGEAR
jgi:nucleotidyltransferase/DNA polymerase involved in DNA repair